MILRGTREAKKARRRKSDLRQRVDWRDDLVRHFDLAICTDDDGLRDLPLLLVYGRERRRIQPVDATIWLNRSAGVSKFSVLRGRSLSRLATAFSLACE